jgi:hypothetical protein
MNKPTKQMDLDADLPTNLSQKNSRVAYSEPKQDAELPNKIIDLTNTQTCGLICHNKNQNQNLLRISLVLSKRSTTQLLLQRQFPNLANTNTNQTQFQ